MDANALLVGPLKEGSNLVHRLQESAVFRSYVTRRLGLIVPAGLLMAVTSLACAAGMVMFLGGTRPMLVLLAMLLLPFVLLGSFFVQAYSFLAWLEGRALARTYARHRASVLPPVPWLLAALFFFLPLAMLVLVAPKPGLALVALLVATPFVYARFED
jgi:hypothetical protein